MKKLILVLIIATLSVALFAQTENLNVITGLTQSEKHTDATITLSEPGVNNEIQINNDAGAITFRLPSAKYGLTVAFYDNAGGIITIIPAAGDNISLDGTDLDILDTIDSSETKGDAITLICFDDATWTSWGPGNGTWVDAGPE